MLSRLLTQIGSFGILSAAGVCLALALLLAYHLKVRKVRGRSRKLLDIELRLEAAWQNARVVSRTIGPKSPVGLSGVFEGGLNTGIKGRVLSMRPLDELPPGTTESAKETAQQSELSCDI